MVAALDGPGAPLSVVRRCADMTDLLATASTGQAAACLIAADLRRMDMQAVGQLTAFGMVVIAIHRAGDTETALRLARMGVRHTAADDDEPAELIALVGRAVREDQPDSGPATLRDTSDPRFAWRPPSSAEQSRPAGDEAAPPSSPGRHHAAPATPAADREPGATDGHALESGEGRGADRVGPAAAAGSAPADAAGDGAGGEPVDPPTARPGIDPADRAAAERVAPGTDGAGHTPGTVVVVWGPGGAPGRTTVAMGVADQAAASGRSVLLIDADIYGGLLASAFGLLDESPGLAGACRLAANGRLDADELTQLCWKVGDRLALLTGIARADRWPEVRPSAIPTVLRIARGLVDLVIVDCAAPLETDEEITFDTMAPRRNGATLAFLDEADLTVAVGSADPPGIERLVRGLADLSAAVDGSSPRVVLNRVRKTAASEAEAIDAVRRLAGVEPVALLPEDRAAADTGWQHGVPLSVAAPKSPLTAAVGRLAATL